MCLTPRNHFEFVDKLHQTKSYTTYNVKIDACDYLDVDGKITVCNNDFVILQLNIRGLYSKTSRLKEVIEEHIEGRHPDIIFLCEMWQSKNSPMPIIEGYSCVHKYQEHRKGGGVAILISENVNYRVRPDLEVNSLIFEHCIIEVKLKSEKLLCCSGYQAPNTDTCEFLCEYEKVLNNMKKDNVKIVKQDIHRSTREFVRLNKSTNLIPRITGPTRIMKSSITLIDNIFVSDEFVPRLRSQIIINDIGDHLPTCVVLENVNIGMKEKRKIVTRNLCKKNVELICSELVGLNWDDHLKENCSDSQNVNETFNCIHNKICDTMNRHAPIKERSIHMLKFKSEAWITNGIKLNKARKH